jgi:hypothetical protein
MKRFRTAAGVLAGLAILVVCQPVSAKPQQSGTVVGTAQHSCPPLSMNRRTISLDLVATGKHDGSGTGLIDESCSADVFVAVTFDCVAIYGSDTEGQTAYASGLGDNGRIYLVKVFDAPLGVIGSDEYGVEITDTPPKHNDKHCGAQNVATELARGDFEITTT